MQLFTTRCSPQQQPSSRLNSIRAVERGDSFKDKEDHDGANDVSDYATFSVKLMLNLMYYTGCTPYKLKRNSTTGNYYLHTNNFQRVLYFLTTTHSIWAISTNLRANAPPFSDGFQAFFTFASSFLSQLGQIVRIFMFHYIVFWKRGVLLKIVDLTTNLHFIQNSRDSRIHKIYLVIVCIYVGAGMMLAVTTGLSSHLTDHLVPWSVPNYSNLLVEGMHREMSTVYPWFFAPNFTEADDVSKTIAALSYTMLARPFFVSQDTLEFLLNMMGFAALQVLHAMNSKLEEINIIVDTDAATSLRQNFEDYYHLKEIMEKLNYCFAPVYLQWTVFSLPIFAYFTAAYFYAIGSPAAMSILQYGAYYYASTIVTLLIPSEIHQQAQKLYTWFLCDDHNGEVKEELTTKAIILMNVERQMDALSLKSGNTFTISYGFFIAVAGSIATYTVVSIQFF